MGTAVDLDKKAGDLDHTTSQALRPADECKITGGGLNTANGRVPSFDNEERIGLR